MTGAFPNFFIVGAMKAGTTAVYEQLRSHPDVHCSPIKEPNFFCDDFDVATFAMHARRASAFDTESYVHGRMDEPVHHAYVRDMATYRALFRDVNGESAICECSTSYLYSEAAAANIRATAPEARILILVRNPVERAISHYLMECRIGIAHGPFAEVLAADRAQPEKGWGISRLYIELGEYTAQIERYLRVFPAGRVKVVVFDDLKRDFDGTMRDIAAFAGIDPDGLAATGPAVNRARVPRAGGLNVVLNRLGVKDRIARHCPDALLDLGKRLYYRDADGNGVTEADREHLRELFAPEVEALSHLLDRDLMHWVEPAPAPSRIAPERPAAPVPLGRLAAARRP